MRAPPALFLSSGDLLADRRYQYAQELDAAGALDAAADLLAQTLERAPDFASAWFALGDLRQRRGDGVGAIAAFERALVADVDDRHGAKLRLARLGHGEADDAMSPAYVSALFDQYAPDFDAALRDRLGYRGPEVLLAALRRTLTAQARSMHFPRIVDLGCGTGLMGGALQGTFDSLVGVDLSAGMIATARRKAVYTELVVADMLTFLEDYAGAADLIVAADAFMYLADLKPICRAAAQVLGTGGVLAVTVETHGGAGILLGEHLRYAHGADHVRGALDQAGLVLTALEPASTRTEGGAPVPGLVAIAIRGT